MLGKLGKSGIENQESGIGDGETGRRYSSVHDVYVALVLPAKILLYKKYIAEQSSGRT